MPLLIDCQFNTLEFFRKMDAFLTKKKTIN